MTFTLDQNFPHEYHAEVILSIPSPAQQIHYFPKERSWGQDGLIVRVSLQPKESWTGMFAFGRLSPNSITGIFSCPSLLTLCVIAKGNGYLVDVQNPASHQKISLSPILHVTSAPRQDLLVFGDFTHLAALGAKGIVWESKQLSWDGLRIEGIVDNFLVGQAWDASTDKHVSFKLDLRNGHHEGGAEPPT